MFPIAVPHSSSPSRTVPIDLDNYATCSAPDRFAQAPSSGVNPGSITSSAPSGSGAGTRVAGLGSAGGEGVGLQQPRTTSESSTAERGTMVLKHQARRSSRYPFALSVLQASIWRLMAASS